jgi:hypothetical protein
LVPEPGGDPVGDATAYVCGHLDDIRWQLERSGDSNILDDLLAALHDGGDVAAGLDALHDALQRGGDALGVYGNARSALPRSLGDFAAGRPAETVYLCPGRRCARYRWPEPGAGPPQCAVDGAPMVAERL